MRNYKSCFRYFALYDKTGICKFLEKQAEKGWLLDTVTFNVWKFKRIEPQKLKFNTVCFLESSSYAAGPSDSLLRFKEYCEHSGWSFATSNEKMLVFYTDKEDAVPIETDAWVEVQNIHKVMRWSFLGLNILLFIGRFLSFFNAIKDVVKSPTQLAWDMSLTLIIVTGLVAFLFLSEIIAYVSWYIKAKRAARLYGVFTPTRSYSCLIYIIIFILIFIAIIECVGLKFSLLVISLPVIILLLIYCSVSIFKKFSAPKWLNFLVAAVVAVSGVLFILKSDRIRFLINSIDIVDSSSVYQYLSPNEFDNIAPITLDDLGLNKVAVESIHTSISESLAMKEFSTDVIYQDNRLLRYTFIEAKLPLVKEIVINRILDDYSVLRNFCSNQAMADISYYPIDVPLWGAEKMYILNVDGKPISRYLLCYDDVIIELDAYFTIEKEHIEAIRDKFSK